MGEQKNGNDSGGSRDGARHGGLVKIIRILVYLVSTVCTTVGACLVKSSSLSSSYADGSATIKNNIGGILFYVSLAVLCVNIIWGVIRWFLRAADEGSGFWRILGKLIGGGVWRTIVFVPLVVVSAIFITPKVEAILASQTKGGEAPIPISEVYDRLKYINDNFESLDFDSIKDELHGLLFDTVDFGVDASSNTSSRNSLFFSNAYAYSSTVTILNKAVLSNAGHFVVFYTDTGDDKISDAGAAELASMLEEIISGYQNNLSFEYKYEKLINNDSSIPKMQRVLENSGIDINILDSAMPVYVVNPYKKDTSTAASYAGIKFKDLGISIIIKVAKLAGSEEAKLYSTTPSYPFINILPKYIDSEHLPILVAHELGHHYAAVYDEDNYGKTGSDDDFIDETAPNWMAINVLPNQPQGSMINGNHHWAYLKSTGDTISEVSTQYNVYGYPAVAFLQNYYEIVPNSKKIIMDAAYYGDALNYLYDHAGEEYFQKVMISLAERNLTGDYQGKLINTVTPSGSTLHKPVGTTHSYINPASIKYVYISTDEHRDTTLSFFGGAGNHASLLGKREENGDWVVIESDFSELEFEIDEKIEKEFVVLALAVADYSIVDSAIYEVKLVKTWIRDFFTDEGKFDFSRYGFSNFYSDIGGGCYEVDTDALFNNLMGLVDLRTDFIGTLTRLGEEIGSGADLSPIRTESERDAEEAKSVLSETKNELSPYKVTVCGHYMNNVGDFDTVKQQLKSAFGGAVDVVNKEDGNNRFSVFVGFDLLSRTGAIYMLAQVGGERGLITINVEEV